MNRITHDIELPSGLTVTVYEPTVGNIKTLSGRKRSEKKLSKKRDNLVAFFTELFVETLDVGPYKWPDCRVFRADGTINWSLVLQGDTSALLLDIRRAMLTEESIDSDGDIFSFDYNCPSKFCDGVIRWETNLSNLKRSRLSDEAIEFIENNGTDKYQEVTLPRSKVSVGWKFLTRGDQFSVDVASDNSPDLLEEFGILSRLPYISGTTNTNERRNFATNLPWPDAEFLRRIYEEHDIYLQDQIKVRCGECRQDFTIPLPFSGADFFSWASAKPVRSRWPSSDNLSLTSDTCNLAEAG
jgi:hypothetical protein